MKILKCIIVCILAAIFPSKRLRSYCDKLADKTFLIENTEHKKYCGVCKHYCTWFGDCFAKENGAGDPKKHNFRRDNFGNRSGICDLFDYNSN